LLDYKKKYDYYESALGGFAGTSGSSGTQDLPEVLANMAIMEHMGKMVIMGPWIYRARHSVYMDAYFDSL
jgi:hypothetical protein